MKSLCMASGARKTPRIQGQSQQAWDDADGITPSTSESAALGVDWLAYAANPSVSYRAEYFWNRWWPNRGLQERPVGYQSAARENADI